MRPKKEGPSCSTEQAIDLISAVKGLHGLNCHELSKLIRDSDNNILQHFMENGSCIQIDLEKLARYLPLHLIARYMSTVLDEPLFKYLLCGFRLLHTLCDLTSRYSKLEQIILDDVKVSEQLLDLIFYLLIILGCYRQEHDIPSHTSLLHSTLVTCCMYLLTGCISSQWPDLAQVLVAHPKVDIFMDAAFAAVRVDIKFLQMKLSAQHTDSYAKSGPDADGTLNHLCQQCEASLQFLQLLCQQKLFRDRLVKNKELCVEGGVLLLAQAIMNLKVTTLARESAIVAVVSRLKSKVLSILLHLCEAESVSYLDEVASTPGSLDLAKSVASEVLDLLKFMFGGDPKELSAYCGKPYPMGILQLNAMRLADILSDDSNFRSYITIYFTEVLAAIFSLPHGEFLTSWCSSDLSVWEEDATLEYDPVAAARWILDLVSSSDSLHVINLESCFIPSNMPQASYAHQRTSLLVKVMANLHCFAPDICKEEKDLFLNKFLQCMQKEVPKLSDGASFICDAEKASIVSKNLDSLLSHAESLIPGFLNEDDVNLLRVFFHQLQLLITNAGSEVKRVQETQGMGRCSSTLLRNVAPVLSNTSGNLREGKREDSNFQDVNQVYVRNYDVNQADDLGRQYKSADKGKERDTQSAETSGSDSNCTREKNSIDQTDNLDFPKSSEHMEESGFGEVQKEELIGNIQDEEKQRSKRKRTIMNDKQIALIEKALLEEPDLKRNAASVQSWAHKLSSHGCEVTTSRLKNWLNNRKARLARAGKDARAPSEGVNNPNHQGGSRIVSLHESPEGPAEDVCVPLTSRGSRPSGIGGNTLRTGTNDYSDVMAAEFTQCEPGQYVVLVDDQRKEIGKGKVYQVNGKWFGRNLKELETCVVDIIELKASRWASLPHPCEATGASFEQAEKKLGSMRVLWGCNKLFMLQSR